MTKAQLQEKLEETIKEIEKWKQMYNDVCQENSKLLTQTNSPEYVTGLEKTVNRLDDTVKSQRDTIERQRKRLQEKDDIIQKQSERLNEQQEKIDSIFSGFPKETQSRKGRPSLDGNTKTMVLQMHKENYSVRKIADHVGISVGSVHKIIHNN